MNNFFNDFSVLVNYNNPGLNNTLHHRKILYNFYQQNICTTETWGFTICNTEGKIYRYGASRIKVSLDTWRRVYMFSNLILSTKSHLLPIFPVVYLNCSRGNSWMCHKANDYTCLGVIWQRALLAFIVRWSADDRAACCTRSGVDHHKQAHCVY